MIARPECALFGVFLYHPLVLKTGVTLLIDSRISCSQARGSLPSVSRNREERFGFPVIVKTARVHFILKFRGAIVDLRANGPAVAAVVSLAPPAVENAQIDSAIRGGLHSAGSARLRGRNGWFQPKIDTLHQAAAM